MLRTHCSSNDINDLSFLFDTERVIKWIESTDYALNSKKAFYIAIVATLKKDEAYYKDPLVHYRVKMSEYNNSQRILYETQEMSAAEVAKMVSWKQVLEVREILRLSADDVLSHQDYLILCLYTMQPPVRLDYANMKILTSDPTDCSDNYLCLTKKPYFVFNQYKTAAKYGQIVKPVPKMLMNVILDHLAHFPDPQFLLVGHKGEPISESVLGQTIIGIFNKHLKKRVGVSILRHAYVNHVRKNDKSFLKQAQLARDMHHSIGMSTLYRKL